MPALGRGCTRTRTVRSVTKICAARMTEENGVPHTHCLYPVRCNLLRSYLAAYHVYYMTSTASRTFTASSTWGPFVSPWVQIWCQALSSSALSHVSAAVRLSCSGAVPRGIRTQRFLSCLRCSRTEPPKAIGRCRRNCDHNRGLRGRNLQRHSQQGVLRRDNAHFVSLGIDNWQVKMTTHGRIEKGEPSCSCKLQQMTIQCPSTVLQRFSTLSLIPTHIRSARI